MYLRWSGNRHAVKCVKPLLELDSLAPCSDLFFRSDLIGYYLAAIRKRLVQWCIVPKVVETEITSVYRSKWYHSCFLLIQCPFWPWIREKRKTVLDLRWSSLRFVSPLDSHMENVCPSRSKSTDMGQLKNFLQTFVLHLLYHLSS